jgi:hypothetical protein
MATSKKKRTQLSSHHDINQSTKTGAKSSRSVGVMMKNQRNTKMPSNAPTTLEQQYVQVFNQQSERSFYADDYNLEQPSALKYVPSTTSPNAEV